MLKPLLYTYQVCLLIPLSFCEILWLTIFYHILWYLLLATVSHINNIQNLAPEITSIIQAVHQRHITRDFLWYCDKVGFLC